LGSNNSSGIEFGDNLELSINFHEGFTGQTPRDMKVYKMAFEQAFKLLSEYVENGIDMDTARKNVEIILNVDGKSLKGKSATFK